MAVRRSPKPLVGVRFPPPEPLTIIIVDRIIVLCSVRLSVRTPPFHGGKEGFDSPTEYQLYLPKFDYTGEHLTLL
jgi:hypothetical protein